MICAGRKKIEKFLEGASGHGHPSPPGREGAPGARARSILGRSQRVRLSPSSRARAAGSQQACSLAGAGKLRSGGGLDSGGGDPVRGEAVSLVQAWSKDFRAEQSFGMGWPCFTFTQVQSQTKRLPVGAEPGVHKQEGTNLLEH